MSMIMSNDPIIPIKTGNAALVYFLVPTASAYGPTITAVGTAVGGAVLAGTDGLGGGDSGTSTMAGSLDGNGDAVLPDGSGELSMVIISLPPVLEVGGFGDIETDADGLIDGDTELEADGLGETLIEIDALGDTDAEGDAEGDAEADGDAATCFWSEKDWGFGFGVASEEFESPIST